MSVLPSVTVLEAWYHTHPPGATSADYPGYPVGGFPELLHECAGLTSGSITSYTRLDIPAVSRQGNLLISFFDHFYNRIHVNPPVLNLGNVIVDTTVEVILWNAYLENKSVTSSNFANDAGVEVTGEAAPYTLTPLSYRVYDVTVLEDGPASVSLNLGWVVSGVSVGFELSAVRIVPFFYPPNWNKGVEETLEWRTSIGSSFTGEEQRQQIRTQPRRSWSYSLLVKKEKTRNVYFDILGFQNKTLGLPIWADKSVLTSQASSGSTVLSVNTAGKGFAQDAIVFVQSGDVIETHEVESVASTTITIQKPITATFPAGSLVYPGAVAYLPSSMTLNRLTDAIFEGSVSFQGVPQNTDPHMPVQAATETLGGYEVVTRRPNWASGIETNFVYDVDELDYQSGITLRAVSRDYPGTIYRLRYLLRNRTEIESFKAMLARLKGRYTPVFVNLFTDDFKLSGNITSSGLGFQVYDNHSDFGIFPERHPLAVSILTSQNVLITRGLESVALNESGLIDIEIATPTGVLLTEADVKRISLCPLCRLASDQVVLNWLTDSVVECDLNWQMVSR